MRKKSIKLKVKKDKPIGEDNLLPAPIQNTVYEDFLEAKAIVSTLWNAAGGPAEIENTHVATVLSIVVDRLKNVEQYLKPIFE